MLLRICFKTKIARRSRCDGFQFAFTFVFTHGDWVFEEAKPSWEVKSNGIVSKKPFGGWVSCYPPWRMLCALTFHSLRFRIAVLLTHSL